MSDAELLAKDYRRWGKTAVRRIVELTKKHGVVCSSHVYSTGTKG